MAHQATSARGEIPRSPGLSGADSNAAGTTDHPNRPTHRRRHTRSTRNARFAATPRTGEPPQSPRRRPTPLTPLDTAARRPAAPEASRLLPQSITTTEEPTNQAPQQRGIAKSVNTYRNGCHAGTGTRWPSMIRNCTEPIETKIETMPCASRPEGSASAFPWWEWRRMRDSNPRGLAPTAANRRTRSRQFARLLLHLDVGGGAPDQHTWGPITRTLPGKTSTCMTRATRLVPDT